MTTPYRSRITGTGHYLPERVVTNADIEKLVATSNQWIVERTGICQRRYAAPGEFASDMAAHAARRALDAAGLSPTDIDLLVVGTISADMPMPSCAAVVQQKLGMRAVMCMDLSAACAGWLYALSIADQFVRTGKVRRAIVIGVELLSRLLDMTDRSTCVLFGDGAGATVIEPRTGTDVGEVLSTHCFLDGSLAYALNIPAGGSQRPTTEQTVAERLQFVHMTGSEIFKAAIKNLASACRTALDEAGLNADEVHWVVAHQANIRILRAVSERVGIPLSRFYINIDRVGNTSSASVPIALDEAARAGLLKPGQIVMVCALGAGVAWGSALLRWQ